MRSRQKGKSRVEKNQRGERSKEIEESRHKIRMEVKEKYNRRDEVEGLSVVAVTYRYVTRDDVCLYRVVTIHRKRREMRNPVKGKAT